MKIDTKLYMKERGKRQQKYGTKVKEKVTETDAVDYMISQLQYETFSYLCQSLMKQLQWTYMDCVMVSVFTPLDLLPR